MSEAEQFIGLAEESLGDLESVEDVSDRMFWNSLYYSVFYSAKAALHSLGFEPKTHEGTDTLVGKILCVDEGFITREQSKFYSRMRTTREEVDYNPLASIEWNKEEMKEKAVNFIHDMKEIVEDQDNQSS